MITIIFAPPRYGKTALMTYLINERAFDYERNKLMRDEVMQRIKGGYYDLTIPKYAIASNYDIICRKIGFTPRPSIVINPYKIGFSNEFVFDLHFLPPYTTVAIQEAQKYFNSRMFSKFPDWQSRFYEAHGHNYLDFFLDVQRPELIDRNISELADLLEVLEMTIDKKYHITWKCRHFASRSLYDLYIASGKKDTTTYDELTINCQRNVFELYDSRNLKPRFYNGNGERDYDIPNAVKWNGSREDFELYNDLYGNEMPKDFYKK